MATSQQIVDDLEAREIRAYKRTRQLARDIAEAIKHDQSLARLQFQLAQASKIQDFAK